MSDETLNPETEVCSNVESATSREELLHELAQCLKKARKSRQLNSEEIAFTLKLRPVYIDALESGDWSEMPGEVYALGFLKQYAAFLNIDVSDTIEKLKTGQYKLTKPLTFPDPPIAPNKTWVIVAALSFVVILILFNLLDNEPTEETARLAPEVSDITALPTAEPLAAAEPVAEGKQNPMTSESMPADDEPAASAKPVTEHAYKLSAIGEDVWFQLSVEESADSPAEMIREALLRIGESTTVYHVSPSLILTCGNPVALEVEIDGKRVITAGSLGESGKVLHNFRLHSSSE